MRIMLNGEQRAVDETSTVADVVAIVHGAESSGRGVAVAVNGEVVPRGRWPQTPLTPDDRVEILRAVGGG